MVYLPIIDLNPVFLTKEKAERYVKARKEIACGIVDEYLQRKKKKNILVRTEKRDEEDQSILLLLGDRGDYISNLEWVDNFCEFWKTWDGKSSPSNYILKGFLIYLHRRKNCRSIHLTRRR